VAGLAATWRPDRPGRTRGDRCRLSESSTPPPPERPEPRASTIRVDATPAWPAPRAAAAFGATIFIVWMLLRASTGDRFVPIVDHANLVFHEAGHLIVGLVSERLSVYGGTLGQLFFPVVAAWQFARRRQTLGFALTTGWACESLLNVAVYLGDARAMRLPLIGGLDPATHHDWREILSRWGLLEFDTTLALLASGLAWVGGIGICLWLMRRWLDGRARENDQ
jgi:hypothetical protein